jgi:subtilisin family serine protease
MPWAHAARAHSLPGSFVLKMELGEAPETVPMWTDVRSGRLAAAQGLDGGVVDRITRHFAGAMRVTRVHPAAASLYRPGERHLKYDEREQVFGLARTFRVDVPNGTPIGALVDSLSQVRAVESVMPNYVTVTPFDLMPSSAPVSARWAAWDSVRAPEALAYEPGDATVIVGVVDTGVAPAHPELAGRLRAGFDTVRLGSSELSLGVELLGDREGVDTRPIDGFVGHGMGCAGVISALGLAMAPGLGGEAQVLPMRGLGAARFPGKEQAVGIGAATDLDMAMKMAVDLGAKVINMSFGTDDSTLDPAAPKPHADVVRYALDRGCILVAASGNNGEETRYWPAAYPGVIAVGSVDAQRLPSVFSTRGEHVALCAPGERIHTLGLRGYQEATGTSFAAPFVAGVAALLVARAQRRSMPIDAELARTVLTESAAPFAGARPAGCGAGVLDAYGALQALDGYIDRTFPDDSGQVEDG